METLAFLFFMKEIVKTLLSKDKTLTDSLLISNALACVRVSFCNRMLHFSFLISLKLCKFAPENKISYIRWQKNC